MGSEDLAHGHLAGTGERDQRGQPVEKDVLASGSQLVPQEKTLNAKFCFGVADGVANRRHHDPSSRAQGSKNMRLDQIVEGNLVVRSEGSSD